MGYGVFPRKRGPMKSNWRGRRRLLLWLTFCAFGPGLSEGAPLPFEQAEQVQSEGSKGATATGSPAHAKSLFEEVKRFLSEKKPVEAANAFSRAVEADPTFADARGNLATLLM